MRIHNGLEDFKPLKYAVVTSGTFDGVHRGHQQILQRLKSVAEKSGGETVLLTFWPHPRILLDPAFNIKLLTTFEEKASLLEEFGVDHLIKIPFTKEFSQLDTDSYIQKVLQESIGTKKLVIGYDHRFGRDREGSFEYLKKNSSKYGFEVEEIPRHEIDHVVVSSTRIRNALAGGEIHIGNEYLGREFSITGTVIDGDKRGRQLGFPTANINIESTHKLIPCDGTYAVRVSYENNAYRGMLNIGFRPTVDGTNRSIEANIFDFDKDIYGEQLKISFVKLIRREMKFENLEELKNQLLKDRSSALELLK
jgi:riboflavin kinase/FMN adenylyltransferase